MRQPRRLNRAKMGDGRARSRRGKQGWPWDVHISGGSRATTLKASDVTAGPRCSSDRSVRVAGPMGNAMPASHDRDAFAMAAPEAGRPTFDKPMLLIWCGHTTAARRCATPDHRYRANHAFPHPSFSSPVAIIHPYLITPDALIRHGSTVATFPELSCSLHRPCP